MDASNSPSDEVERVRPWIPHGVEAQSSTPTISREFWMPDRSCRFCFACDSQFSFLNRRHHCRICGFVFCGICTLKTIPNSAGGGVPSAERKRLRVCNYCYDHRESGRSPSIEPARGLLPSSPTESLISESLGRGASVVPISTQQTICCDSSDRSFLWFEALDESSEPKHTMRPHEGGSRVLVRMPTGARDELSSPYCFSRSDEDEDEYEKHHGAGSKQTDPRPQNRQDDNEDYNGSEVGQDSPDIERKSESSHHSSRSSIGHTSLPDDASDSIRRVEIGDRKGSPELLDEVGDDDRPMYEGEITMEARPFVDYESNSLIWVPPPAADDQDDDDNEDEDSGFRIIDDDDDDDEGGVWGMSQSPGSVSTVVAKKDKLASNEHRKSIQPQVANNFQNLVAKLLQQENIEIGEPGNPDSWLEIVSTLSWQAASLVKPDTSKGGGMDPGGYVKIKCIASGRPSDSLVVDGIVCRKNVAHKRMTTRYKNPRLLLLGGALEYQRVSNQLSSLDTLLQQERDHLSMTVARIEAHHPNVLLVEKTVSRFAQEILVNKDITLVLNVKKALLERIARCVGAQVIPSPDNLVAPKAVHCEHFHVEKFVEEHGSAGQGDGKGQTESKGQGGKAGGKFLMFFEGVPKPLGCTVLLKGANGDFLKKVKRVVHLAVFSAYHLALETSFLADEGATLPDLDCRPPNSAPRLSKYTNLERSMSSVSVLSSAEESGHAQQGVTIRSSNLPISPRESVVTVSGTTPPVSNVDNSSTGLYAVPFSASSSCVSSAGNSPGTSPAQSSFGFQSGVSRTSSIGGTQTTTYHHVSNGVYPGGQSWQGVSGLSVSLKRELIDNNSTGQDSLDTSSSSSGNMAFEVKALEVNTVTGPSNIPHADQIVTTTASMLSKGIIQDRGDNYHIVPEEVQAHLRVLIHQNNWQSEMELSKEDFPPSPSDQQSILVQLSSRCLTKGAVCKAPHFLRITYYGNADKPLGSFLRDSLFDTNHPCRSCEEPGDAHVHCFTHRQGSLTISVRRLLDPKKSLSGEKEGRIWMWHRCLRCPPVNGVPPATPRVIMSQAAWDLSFGKFLELSFSTHSAASRVAACGHSLHRDCLRFYGFGNMVACFRYAQIILHSVFLPPLQLEFNCPNQQNWLRKEVDEVSAQAKLVFAEVVRKLGVLGEKSSSARAIFGNNTALDAKRKVVALERLQKEKASFEEALHKAATGHAFADILELNWLRRALYICSAEWDRRLEQLASRSLPTRKRPTGFFDDPSLIPMVDDNLKMPESQDAERDYSKIDVPSSDLQRLPSGVESYQGINPGSNSPELKVVEVDSTKLEPSGLELADSVVEINNSPDTLRPKELADENGLDFKLGEGKHSVSASELLGNIDLESKNVRLSSVKSMSLDSVSVDKPCRSQLETNEQKSRSDASNQIVDSLTSFMVNALPKETFSLSLDGDLTTRTVLSEGNIPILTDFSNAIETIWKGNEGCGDVDRVNLAAGKLRDNSNQPHGDEPEAEAKEAVQPNSTMAQATLEIGAPEGELASQDLGGSSDTQISVPTSPVKSDSSEELIEEWMGAPVTNFVKSYGRTPSNLSKPSLPGHGSIIPRATQKAADAGVRVLLQPGHDGVIVAVYDDEPTTMIAYALSTEEHYVHVTDLLVEKEKLKEKDQEKDSDHMSPEQVLAHPLQTADIVGEVDTAVKENINTYTDLLISKLDSEFENPLTSTKASQMVKKTITFSDEAAHGKVKFQVTCYFAKQFDALRKQCCMGNTEYIRSLCHCKKWGAQGGKSNVFFAKTADDRFVVKQVTRTELSSFLDFASAYFKYLNEALTTGNPTCLAKIFGVYEVKTSKGGKETKMDVLVMENLLYGRHITRLYDLKGSVRSRYNADSSGKNQVLLDQNLVEAMPTNPIFVGSRAKRLLERAVWNDTHFLSLVFVMDYSLLVGVDEVRQELVVGIIDFIRQYTWDKHLETWVKASGFLGGPKNVTPTVISPKQYKKRFRKAMSTYFLMVPELWIPPSSLAVPQVVDPVEENSISIVMKKEDSADDAETLRQHFSGGH